MPQTAARLRDGEVVTGDGTAGTVQPALEGGAQGQGSSSPTLVP